VFDATIDHAELELINAVARAIDPGAWDDRPVTKKTDWGTWAEDEAITRAARNINEVNRNRAREIAINVIHIVRESK